jgi:tripartite-type tricarboxylate transporter receptor subunit TctC
MKQLLFAMGAAASLGLSSVAFSQTYPERPIRLITAGAPGAALDGVSRLVAAKLSELLGQQVIVENRPGAGGTIAPAIAAKATPDGYTFLHCGIANTIAPAVYQRLSFDFLRDFSPISLVGMIPNILVVHPSIPVRSVEELIAYARTHPGKMAYASTGVGTATHLSMELFKSMTATDIVHVPYKGGPFLMADLLAGRVSTMISNVPAQVDNVRTGKVRGLAVSTLKRSAHLPEVPTLDESGMPGFDVTSWHGLCGPAAMPKALIARINGEVANAISSEDLRSRLDKMGVDPQSTSSAQFTALFRSETARWAKVVKEAGIPAQ